MARKHNRPCLSLIVQKLGLLAEFPESNCSVMRGVLTWIGCLQPSLFSAKYTVRVIYKPGKRPAINVLDPELEKPKGRSLPHVYSGDELCVYTPWNHEWSEDQRLVDTIIPWISEWLYHYEFWLITGNWHGGGTHPDRYDYKKKRKQTTSTGAAS